MKKQIEITSFYYGFPVFLASTVEPESQTPNIAPLSSSLSLGDRIIIGVNKISQTSANLLAGSDVVINVPDYRLWEEIEQMGRLTGTQAVPESKAKQGVLYCADKTGIVGMHVEPSHTIAPPRVRECPIQAECKTREITDKGAFILAELEIQHIWAEETLLNEQDKLDSLKWHPLIYKFREYDTTGKALGFNCKYGK
ncbi:flavin reductase family protein [Musicola paradisiaca]|uniref:Flavin reductase domain protein FMN-binding n=1 Tax=Musicola paradisiaca (strain Ech703) TaxID=579405 RepID=C6C9X5_MUSP7|nr:flavin reductase [Musicola paradisiaca]ACS86397.1 flavin reductase domain protein FMN-binding [Musicola paradisiaca Ech703]